jgi:hypothetical protein
MVINLKPSTSFQRQKKKRQIPAGSASHDPLTRRVVWLYLPSTCFRLLGSRFINHLIIGITKRAETLKAPSKRLERSQRPCKPGLALYHPYRVPLTDGNHS